MGIYNIVEAKEQFSRIIEEVKAGIPATITSQGEPVATISPVTAAPRPLIPADYEAIARRRNTRRRASTDSVTAVRELRDEFT